MIEAGGAGSAVGGTIGAWGGGILGGALGELFGPEAVVPGAMLGRRLGRWGGELAGKALAEWLAHHISHANEEADRGKEAQADAKPACAQCAKRSKPGQTCYDDRLAELEAEKDRAIGGVFTNDAFRSGNAKKLSRVSCADARQRVATLRTLRDVRQKIQDECYGGKPDASHQAEIEALDRAITRAEGIVAIACASELTSLWPWTFSLQLKLMTRAC